MSHTAIPPRTGSAYAPTIDRDMLRVAANVERSGMHVVHVGEYLPTYFAYTEEEPAEPTRVSEGWIATRSTPGIADRSVATRRQVSCSMDRAMSAAVPSAAA